MLDYETKKNIDDARDILVGKIPDPKSQVEQITIALIYKFMGDMDRKSKDLGGKSKFFTGEYEKYSWSNIFDPSISGFELVNLYGEALQKMSLNDKIPILFRSIFKNAYLPYRDPETLKSFLKIIDKFNYDHSENLGSAYEYLLSIMSAQGDAGQFRTPRHIIDFIVDVVDPTERDTILDPACGTAGFLISAYKHIIAKHTDEKGNLKLTAEQRKKLNENFVGYDISPDMIRISLVNMYLHNFKDPKITEYDTLTSEDHWEDRFDVILANPPFMTPKGGIKPHHRFSIEANRSEVLFVDYIAEHLNPNGKSGIIVPEGIIFQSGNAYKKLRELLVKDYLYAVVSLPAGVFNPYSGVKTSILLLDKKLSKQTKDILFVKVSNDGYGLGAQRREIKDNDLLLAKDIITKYQKSILENKDIELTGLEQTISSIISKDKIAQSEDYNLSGDRYITNKIYDGKWPLVELDTVCELITDGTHKTPIYVESGIPFLSTTNLVPYSKDFNFKSYIKFISLEEHQELIKRAKPEKGDLLISKCGTIGVAQVIRVNYEFSIFVGLMLIKLKKNLLNSTYLEYIINQEDIRDKLISLSAGASRSTLTIYELKKFRIPLPPIDIQEKIVEELENYQDIIEGAKKVVNNYKPNIKIDTKWEVFELNQIVDLVQGINTAIDNLHYVDNGIKVLQANNIFNGAINFDKIKYITKEEFNTISDKYKPTNEDILYSNIGARFGYASIIEFGEPFTFSWNVLRMIIKDKSKINKHYLANMLNTDGIRRIILSKSSTSTMPFISGKELKKIKIPLPPIDIQKQIVSQIEEEQKLVESNKRLIDIFEKKIKCKISEVWGE